VKIYLPRYVGDLVPAAPQDAGRTIEVGHPGEVIMVVEDDDRVRNMSVEALRELGYTVIEASRPWKRFECPNRDSRCICSLLMS
jgi:hypothetical protein